MRISISSSLEIHWISLGSFYCLHDCWSTLLPEIFIYVWVETIQLSGLEYQLTQGPGLVSLESSLTHWTLLRSQIICRSKQKILKFWKLLLPAMQFMALLFRPQLRWEDLYQHLVLSDLLLVTGPSYPLVIQSPERISLNIDKTLVFIQWFVLYFVTSSEMQWAALVWQTSSFPRINYFLSMITIIWYFTVEALANLYCMNLPS